MNTVATLFAEVGDIHNFRHPQQFVNVAGLSLREHSSEKYKGQTRIYKRGRKRLRKTIYLALRPLVRYNPAFRALHEYFTTRLNRPPEKATITYCSMWKIVTCILCHWSKTM